MQYIIPCPECANRIRVTADLLGKRVRCPRCGEAFDALPSEGASPVTAAADPLPAPGRERERSDGPRSTTLPARQDALPPAEDTGAWESVLTGVNLQMYAHLLAILGGLMVVGSTILLAASLNDRTAASPTFIERLLGTGVVLGTLLLVANWIVSLTANGFTLAAPTARGSRPLAVTAIALTALVLVTLQANQLSPPATDVLDFNLGHSAVTDPRLSGDRTGSESHHVTVGLAVALSVFSLSTLLDVARLGLVPLFVRSVGQNVRDRATADKARVATWIVAVVFFAAVAMELLLRLRSRSGPGHARGDDTRVMFLLAFALAVARLLILLAGLYSLSRAKASLTRHLSAAVRAEVP